MSNDTLTRLSDADRSLITRARELAGLSGSQVRERSGYDDPAYALADALGRAQSVLADLVSLAERLAS